MSIHAKCPACGVEFVRPDGMAGKNEKCPECRYVFRLPTAKSPYAAPTPAPRPHPKAAQPLKPPVKKPVAPIVKPAAPIIEERQPETEVERPLEEPVARPIVPVVEEQPQFQEAELPPIQPELPPLESELPSPQFEESQVFPEEEVMLPQAEESQEYFEEEVVLPKVEANHSLEPNVDYVALAAGQVSAGTSLDGVVDVLFEQGMDEVDAQQLAESMFKVANSRKKSKALLLFRTVIGLLFAGAFGYGAWFAQTHERNSDTVLYVCVGLAVVGLLMLFSGIYRLATRSRMMKAEKLIAAWRKHYR